MVISGGSITKGSPEGRTEAALKDEGGCMCPVANGSDAPTGDEPPNALLHNEGYALQEESWSGSVTPTKVCSHQQTRQEACLVKRTATQAGRPTCASSTTWYMAKYHTRAMAFFMAVRIMCFTDAFTLLKRLLIMA